MMRLAHVAINTSALKHNLARIQALAPESRVLAMVKADGYGHDAVQMAKALSKADAVGVARIGEAITLIQAGVEADIVLMEGCFDIAEYELAIEHGFQLVIHNDTQLAQFLSLKTDASIRVWLKLDTGMHRLGFSPEQYRESYRALKQCTHCHQDNVLMTHFACADDPDNSFNEQQLSLFQDASSDLNGLVSIANSATILTRPDRHLDWVRPGIILYGASPVLGTTAADFQLKPVMTFSSNVIAVKRIAKGERVGYGGDWQAARDTVLAVIGVGYGDGYPRHAKSGTPVLVKGARAQLVGRVSMDMITVDVTDLAPVSIGDAVTLWGEGLPAEEVAEWASTISYTLFCGITNRVARSYVRSEKQ